MNGKYRVEHVLGEGGMGIVVAARHLELEELYAIKVMKREALGSDAYAEHRFIGEARAAARLKGEHVARVHDIGRLNTGELYMVMEHLKGTDLKQVVRKRGALPVQEAVTYLLQTCEAIAEAHALHIIHRDIKPHNLFLLDGGSSIKVLDFGISKQVTAGGPDVTGTNVTLGTLSYMAPEQMEQSKRVDARSDVWSMGVVFYELVTGEVPFPGQGIVEIFTQICQGAPTQPSQLQPGLPAAVDTVVARCLQRDPAQRFSSANELAGALRSLIVPSSAGAALPIAQQPVSEPATSSVDSLPPASSVSDATTTKKRKRSLVEKPVPVFHRTEVPAPPALRNETTDGPTWSMEGSPRRVRQRRRGAIGLAAFGLVVLMLVAFQGWLTRSAATPQPAEGAHESSSSQNVRQPSGPSPRAEVLPWDAGEPKADARVDAPSPSAPGPNAPSPQLDEKPPEGSPTAKVAPQSERDPSRNVPTPSKRTHNDNPDTDTIHKARIKDETLCTAEFPYLDKRDYTLERRSYLIKRDICSVGPDGTKLCCRLP